MTHKEIEDILKTYKYKKSAIDITLARVEGYRFALENPDLHEGVVLGSAIEPGMPRARRNASSPVEAVAINKESGCDLLRSWIAEDESRIYPYTKEVEQIELALEALTEQARFIIELKYFEGSFWSEIEVKFNDEFKTKNYVTFEWLKKINKESISILKELLQDYYKRYEIISKVAEM